MPEDDGRVAAEGAVHDVKVCAADAAEGNFDFDLASAADGFVNVEDIEVAFSGGEFDKGFHEARCTRDIRFGRGMAICAGR